MFSLEWKERERGMDVQERRIAVTDLIQCPRVKNEDNEARFLLCKHYMAKEIIKELRKCKRKIFGPLVSSSLQLPHVIHSAHNRSFHCKLL